jgi:predicted TIM-barrel fold metal-dependent hydrolase
MMLVIDSQIHPYERDHPGRPWISPLPGPDEATGEQLVTAMDELGVDGAILVSAFALYRYDASYAVSVRDRFPDRFALVKPIDPTDPAIEEIVTDWARTPGAVAARILIAPPHVALEHGADPGPRDAGHPGLNLALSTAARLSLPINLACVDDIGLAGDLARAHPDCSIVIDHLGLRQPPMPLPDDRFEKLPPVLALARCPNISIKISGVCTLSTRPYPYEDMWEPLRRVFDAFGIDRCMWGTDWTRTADHLSFREGVDAFRKTPHLSESDRAALMGGTLQRIYGWTPAMAGQISSP